MSIGPIIKCPIYGVEFNKHSPSNRVCDREDCKQKMRDINIQKHKGKQRFYKTKPFVKMSDIKFINIIQDGGIFVVQSEGESKQFNSPAKARSYALELQSKNPDIPIYNR